MTSSSSRVRIALPSSPERLSDRVIAQLLSWYDNGSAYRLRRWCRHSTANTARVVRFRLQHFGERIKQQSIIQRCRTTAEPTLRLIGQLAKPPLQRASRLTSLVVKRIAERFPSPPTTAVESLPRRVKIATLDVPKKKTQEIGALSAPHKNALIQRLAPEIKPAMTPAPTATDPTLLRDPTILRCWSCQRRVTIAAPRRGGCYHCPECSTLMTVIDPAVGMTCSFHQAGERGVRINSQACETESYTEPELRKTAQE